MTGEAAKAAVEAGMDAFRRELEDEGQHIEDAVRIALLVAISRIQETAE